MSRSSFLREAVRAHAAAESARHRSVAATNSGSRPKARASGATTAISAAQTLAMHATGLTAARCARISALTASAAPAPPADEGVHTRRSSGQKGVSGFGMKGRRPASSNGQPKDSPAVLPERVRISASPMARKCAESAT